MDAAGWARIEDVLRVLNIRRAALERAVRENDKQRLQLEDDRVRASQGHSFDGTPVTLEALEASWSAYDSNASVWHGTHESALESIGREGLKPRGRTHVHLAAEIDSRVGKRAGVAVMLEVAPERVRERELTLFVSPNGVVLVRGVPPNAIVGMRAMTKRAQGRDTELRARLNLS